MPEPEIISAPIDSQAPTAEPVSLPAPAPPAAVPWLPGGFGGAGRYVPSAEDVAEQKRIHAEVEARGGRG